jgi:hypothetical protein
VTLFVKVQLARREQQDFRETQVSQVHLGKKEFQVQRGQLVLKGSLDNRVLLELLDQQDKQVHLARRELKAKWGVLAPLVLQVGTF